jgi:hypothetical protein
MLCLSLILCGIFSSASSIFRHGARPPVIPPPVPALALEIVAACSCGRLYDPEFPAQALIFPHFLRRAGEAPRVHSPAPCIDPHSGGQGRSGSAADFAPLSRRLGVSDRSRSRRSLPACLRRLIRRDLT